MREEMTFWLAVALVAVAAVGLFRVLAAGPLARMGIEKRAEIGALMIATMAEARQAMAEASRAGARTGGR